MMGSAGITNKGPINTQTTGQGAIAGFDPIMRMHKRANKRRKKWENAGKQWEHRKKDPTYIDGRSKQARKLIKRLSKRKKMTESTLLEYGGDNKSGGSGGDNTNQAYKFISQKRKVQKKQEREKRATNRKQEIQMISRAKASDYQKKAKDRQKKLSTQLATKKEEWDGIVYMESLFEQLENENENPVFYFFNDESELEVTNEQAYDIVEKFGSLSDDNKEMFLDKIAESKKFLSHIILL
tara:strand:- start:1023 stop:1739 length:717 start_codon:yes stop_codon:yes gene_type:complete